MLIVHVDVHVCFRYIHVVNYISVGFVDQHAKIEWDFFMMQIPLSNSQASPENEKRKYDHLCKIVLLGESGTGKTSILERYVNNSFPSRFIPTVSSLYLVSCMYL